ncbi:MAG: hypothetical protein GX626_13265 [Spirochaetales bacterium]|nr:hypothetical protein [Spirochaetales bacterium]
MKTRSLKVMSVLLLIGLLIGCTSGGFEIGPGGPNLHLEFSKEATQEAEAEPEEEASAMQEVKGERPSLAAWDQNAEAFTHVIGDRVTLELPPNGFSGNLWGLGEYTTDSSIGSAAVHMGLITFQKGGVVTIEITDGRTKYGGLLRNSVVSSTYESWPLSFVFVDAKGKPITLQETGGVQVDWSNTIRELGLEEGQTMTVTLPAGGTEKEVWGSDPYTGDTPIGSAAVHKGLVTFDAGGTVTVQMLPMRSTFAGSERNGIESYEYDAPNEAFTFVR